VRAPDESFDLDDDFMEELADTILVLEGGVEHAVKGVSRGSACVGCQGGVDPAEPTTLVGIRMVGHRLTHKPTDPGCDEGVRGNMKNLRKYAGALSRPLQQFGDIITMDHRSFSMQECSMR
jgi:hypothetical protein